MANGSGMRYQTSARLLATVASTAALLSGCAFTVTSPWAEQPPPTADLPGSPPPVSMNAPDTSTVRQIPGSKATVMISFSDDGRAVYTTACAPSGTTTEVAPGVIVKEDEDPLEVQIRTVSPHVWRQAAQDVAGVNCTSTVVSTPGYQPVSAVGVGARGPDGVLKYAPFFGPDMSKRIRERDHSVMLTSAPILISSATSGCDAMKRKFPDHDVGKGGPAFPLCT